MPSFVAEIREDDTGGVYAVVPGVGPVWARTDAELERAVREAVEDRWYVARVERRFYAFLLALVLMALAVTCLPVTDTVHPLRAVLPVRPAAPMQMQVRT